MGFIGDAGTPVTNLTGGEVMTGIVDGVALKEITAANFVASTVMTQAIADFIGAFVTAGSNVTFARVGNFFTITASVPAPYTDAQVKAVMGANILAGANVSAAYDPIAGTVTLSATAPASYTDAMARAAVSGGLIGDPGYLNFTSNPGAGTITGLIDPAFKAQVDALGPGTFVQTNDTVVATSSYVTLPGTASNYVSSPSSSAANITGDIEFCVRLSPTLWIPAAEQVFYSKWVSAANGHCRLAITTSGFLKFSTTLDAVNTVSGTTTVTPGGVDGTPMWVKITRASATGACNFYTCPDQETEPLLAQWVTLQTNRGNQIGALPAASTATLNVGGYNSGATLPFAGKVYRVIVKSGIAGTIAVDFNPSSWVSGATWVSASGETWTLNGTAAVTAGSSTSVSNTLAEFSLAETDAHTSTPLALHDTMFFFTTFGLVNTSGASATFLFKVTLNGATLFLIPIQTLTSVASSVRNGALMLRIDMNGSSGSSQMASAEFVIANATTGTGSGSDTLATDFVRLSGNRYVSTLTTFNSVPQIQLRCTMGTAASTISAQRGFTQLVLGKA